MKSGAFDYITKPFKNDEVLVVVRNAMERRRLVHENRSLRQNIQERYHKFANIIGRSPRMRQVFDLIIQAAPSRSTILIQGESGTGKELVARAIHANSSRSDRSFVTVNSGNLPPDLLESTLFGHVKGAFTGAVYPKKGLFDLADKGSIFFDEIGNVPLETQAKLLRVIQERDFMRLGGMETIKVDVRIIAATNVDLRQMMEEGRFREDLFYRLHVISIQLPPLRDRKDDIPLLTQHFLEQLRRGEPQAGPRADAGRARPAERVRLAGQRPRARERDRAGGRADVGPQHRRRSSIPDHVRKSPSFQMPPQFVVPPEGISFKDVDHRLREAAHRVDARGRRRRAEARRRAAAHQADDAERDDQAPRHPAAAQADRQRRGSDYGGLDAGRSGIARAARGTADAGRNVRRQVKRIYLALRTFASTRSGTSQARFPSDSSAARDCAAASAQRGAHARVVHEQLEARDELVPIARNTGRRCWRRSVRPAPDCARCARMGVPTLRDSRASSDRPSSRGGARDDGRGFERLQPLPIGHQESGESDVRILRQRHQLDADERQRRVATLLDVAG